MKSDATSPAVHSESAFATAAICAHKDRDAMILDIPGALFTRVDTKDEVSMLLRDPLDGDNGPNRS